MPSARVITLAMLAAFATPTGIAATYLGGSLGCGTDITAPGMTAPYGSHDSCVYLPDITATKVKAVDVASVYGYIDESRVYIQNHASAGFVAQYGRLESYAKTEIRATSWLQEGLSTAQATSGFRDRIMVRSSMLEDGTPVELNLRYELGFNNVWNSYSTVPTRTNQFRYDLLSGFSLSSDNAGTTVAENFNNSFATLTGAIYYPHTTYVPSDPFGFVHETVISTQIGESFELYAYLNTSASSRAQFPYAFDETYLGYSDSAAFFFYAQGVNISLTPEILTHSVARGTLDILHAMGDIYLESESGHDYRYIGLVPESGTGVLFSIGCIGLAMASRFRRRVAQADSIATA